MPNFTKGDITLAVLVDGVKQDSFPDKNGHKYVGYECSNDATVDVTYDDEISNWKVNLSTTKPTICTISFESYTSRDLIEVLKETNELVKFTHEATVQTGANTNIDYRYIGKDPNNYVLFNDELWRIIGIFNTDDGTGEFKERVKLIKNESIGNMAWDTNGKNDWSNATLQKYLNGEYYNNLNDSAKNMIGNSKWYLGGLDGSRYVAEQFYQGERNNNVYGTNPKNWIGKVALAYPSDYGFATSGDCLKKSLDNYNDSLCFNNNWLQINDIQWLITASSSFENRVFSPLVNGNLYDNSSYGAAANWLARGCIYLKYQIKTSSGIGTKADPYILSIE